MNMNNSAAAGTARLVEQQLGGDGFAGLERDADIVASEANYFWTAGLGNGEGVFACVFQELGGPLEVTIQVRDHGGNGEAIAGRLDIHMTGVDAPLAASTIVAAILQELEAAAEDEEPPAEVNTAAYAFSHEGLEPAEDEVGRWIFTDGDDVWTSGVNFTYRAAVEALPHGGAWTLLP